MIANITEQLWIDFDLDTAVFLDTISYWIKKNVSNQRHFHEGNYWTYNSYPAFTKLFPGWSIETLRRIIRNCVNDDLLIIGNFNKKNYDNTNWYALTDKGLSYYPKLAGMILYTPVGTNTPPVGTNRPIPELQHIRSTTISELKSSPATQGQNQPQNPPDVGDHNPSLPQKTVTENPNPVIRKRQQPKTQNPEPEEPTPPKKPKPLKTPELMREMIDIYCEVFPDNPQPHPTLIATSLQRTLQTLTKRWPEADPNGNPLTLEAFGRYMEHLRLTAPNFSLGEYRTDDGRIKKNGLETFCRWNTLVQFLEGKYS